MNFVTPEFPDVFSVPVKGVNGEEMFLEQYRGKVLIFVNTTGHCANVTQFPILQEIQKEYLDKHVQIVYVPTNDYCNSVTYGEYKDGIKDGKDAEAYAKEQWGVEAPFTEMLSSRNVP